MSPQDRAAAVLAAAPLLPRFKVTSDERDSTLLHIRPLGELTHGQRHQLPTLLGAAGFRVTGHRRRRGFVPEQFTVRHRSTYPD